MSRETLPLTAARLACGCIAGFRHGFEGSPITVMIDIKAETCHVPFHVTGLPVFDQREALRPSTRHTVVPQPDFEDDL